MGIIRRIFGVSNKTHQRQLSKLNGIIETLKRHKSAETKAKLRAVQQYEQQKARGDNLDEDIKSLIDQRRTLTAERDRLVGINRQIGSELARVRELFTAPFASDEAKKLALEAREVWVRHLQKPSGMRARYTSKDVTLAVTVARQEQERKQREEALAHGKPYPGKDAGPPEGAPALEPPGKPITDDEVAQRRAALEAAASLQLEARKAKAEKESG